MTVAFKTFGCRLNQAETAQYAAAFAAAGIANVPFGAPADIVVVHTCTVTRTAEDTCLKQLRHLRRNAPEALLVVSGCAVETVPARALDALTVDLVVPREHKDELVARVLRRLGVGSPLPPVPCRPIAHRATLKIQDGCDFACAYCIIPHTRGKPQSRPFDACVREARDRIAAGFAEIVVTGCNIACYEDAGRRLPDLLAALANLPGLGRLRIGSLEPGTVEREVIALMAECAVICRFLHLPVQSGDNTVLARMRRRYTIEEVAATVSDAVGRMPDLGLGADLIAGFPGETPEEFARTKHWVSRLPFSNLHVFPFSERPGTPAAAFGGTVPQAERKRRVRELNRIRTRMRGAFAGQFIGRTVRVLIERVDAAGRGSGWTGEYLGCRVEGLTASAEGRLVSCVPYAREADLLLARNPEGNVRAGRTDEDRPLAQTPDAPR
ncbi:MAG: MiaB/RimO family radical SAM methylthiotransferase [Kiritimatiellia bacterium]|jgi:threonylcarbamoyladenosine tRNA methylthiotransferase MtaB|nr:MiaB/RimO family radical SAM methylthiotransferase [Kiritimatiellia bacterium]